MDTAYEKETNKLIRAWIIGRNTAYIKPEEDIFYANPDEIVDYNDTLEENDLDYIEVRFKRGHDRQHKNGEISAVRPHFFIKNKKKYNIQTMPESPEHKKIKDFIYRKFFDENSDIELYYSKYVRKDEIVYNSINLSDLDLDWERFNLKKEDIFEVGITDTYNTRRVDLFLRFNNFHPMFGEGIVIEVQLSPQSEEKTKERTIDRALKGYSSVWINKNHFEDYRDDNLVLKNNQVYINSYHSEMYKSLDVIPDKIDERIKDSSRKFQQTADYYKNEMKYKKDEFINDMNNAVNELQKVKEQSVSVIEDKENSLRDLLNQLEKARKIQEGDKCPKCQIGQIVMKKGGEFLGCSAFSDPDIKCKLTYSIKNER